ncbi:fungal-specific transcription factor domain-containing protein [Truncatella angustata]|uniref:Fungal-specific transcription factor domain-containing protein n=1 Tax=Truncatella angustata TaxID=152316 RepID=A0A9P8UCV8_9PEZI|nr:fungal-specific transcription factor domain-containing protein [Truncatella angustata]KAH6647181.1 fungal-specific transcription factor domain-containing protein [Truncatella angustata]KAH8200550.1 hypothetical protein TruAng_005268 [Truncatella angustata]
MFEVKPSRYGSVQFVNVGFWDIHLHEFLSQNGRGENNLEHQYLLTHFNSSTLNVQLNPYHLNRKLADLLEYFCVKVFSSIGNFNQDSVHFHGLIRKLAFSDNSLSSNAIIQATLALSALHRTGRGSEALRLKSFTLQTLKASSKNGMTPVDGIQHVVAVMILCYFEIEDACDTHMQWMLYVVGSKNLMQALKLREQPFSGEFSALLDWVDYHFVIGIFTLRHWQAAYRRQLSHDPGIQHVVCMKKLVPNISDCSHPMLDLLYEISNTVKRPTEEGYFSQEYAAYLKDLENRVMTVPFCPENLGSSSTEAYLMGAELYQIAALIYLERTSCNFSGQSIKIMRLVERGFEIFQQQDTSSASLAIFILGLEARSDEQRKFILDLIERNATRSNLRSLEAVSRMLQAAWNQDDLETENDVNYVLKLDTIINSNNIIPALA